jgi:hypothetical protein
VKVRLWGTPQECQELAGRLARVVRLVEVSGPYPDRRGGGLVRVYAEVVLAGPPDPPPGEGAEPDRAAAFERARRAARRDQLG